MDLNFLTVFLARTAGLFSQLQCRYEDEESAATLLLLYLAYFMRSCIRQSICGVADEFGLACLSSVDSNNRFSRRNDDEPYDVSIFNMAEAA